MSEYKRLTTNEPQSNVETMLNYARCKDKEVFIYDEQGNEVKLTEYIAKHAQEECEVTAEDVMEGCCFECMDCPLGVLNTVAIQAAELRHRLSELEDKLEAGTLVELPCKVGDTFYSVDFIFSDGYEFDKKGHEKAVHFSGWKIIKTEVTEKNIYRICDMYVSGKIFETREAAEARLKELEGKTNELYSNNCR